MKSFLKRFLNYPVSLLLLFGILYLSLFKPSGNSSFNLVANIDKIAHFLIYAVLSAVMWLEHYRSHARIKYMRILVMSFFIPVLFSGVMELMQSGFTDYRSADYYDFLFNLAGAFSANVVCFLVIKPLLDKKYKRG